MRAFFAAHPHCGIPAAVNPSHRKGPAERAAQYGVTMVAAKAATAEKSIKISEERFRIVIFLLPQNNWCSEEGNPKLSLLRNTVFAVTGIGVIILYALSGNTYGYHMTRMVAAIIISFGCYLPVTLLSKKMPKVGLLIIPKTCAYIWIIVMGLQLLFRAA